MRRCEVKYRLQVGGGEEARFDIRRCLRNMRAGRIGWVRVIVGVTCMLADN